MLGLIFHKKINKTNLPSPPAIKNICNYLENKPDKKQLVARWIKDENSQLRCEWVFE